ncbi:MAG TPA: hypothetical protein DER09_10920 [Prolixibacteraceae bacterium]|nr:hypothetical protein [Prolixibacteraceae bacterium]
MATMQIRLRLVAQMRQPQLIYRSIHPCSEPGYIPITTGNKAAGSLTATELRFNSSEVKKLPGWKWEVRGGMLYIIGGNGKSEDYVYKFEGNNLYMEVTLLGQQVWSAPMLKQ